MRSWFAFALNGLTRENEGRPARGTPTYLPTAI